MDRHTVASVKRIYNIKPYFFYTHFADRNVEALFQSVDVLAETYEWIR